MVMLPDEILLTLLNDQLPGRESQIRTLATLFNVKDAPTRLLYTPANSINTSPHSQLLPVSSSTVSTQQERRPLQKLSLKPSKRPMRLSNHENALPDDSSLNAALQLQ
jgi:hypothetical protein